MINNHLSTVFGALALVISLSTPAFTAEAPAAPDPAAQREFTAKVNVCGACHGQNGQPVRPGIPIIWGQQEQYLTKQIHDFEEGARTFEVMKWMTETMTPAERESAITYFAKKAWPAKAQAAAAPQRPQGMAVCEACHQLNFAGGLLVPRLAGQNYEYLVESMRRFADGERKNSPDMQQMMTAFSPEQREAMARYLSSL